MVMRALVLAAGLGTRLRPWTLSHPKALVPVAGIPMLERVLAKLESEGFDRIAVNIHHFGDQIVDYLSKRKSSAQIIISDESARLLDTGGGILRADELLGDDSPLLVHNTDILSNAPLWQLMEFHMASSSDATLLTSDRPSSRRLIFDEENKLQGWVNLSTGEVKPKDFILPPECVFPKVAFSGIYIMGKSGIDDMRKWATTASFPIMDYLLARCRQMIFRNFHMPRLQLLDIGKPDALTQAERFVAGII